MDGGEDCYANRPQKQQNGGTKGDFGEMSFMMLDYIKEAMKVRFNLVIKNTVQIVIILLQF